jgi:hypothetical protein
MVAAKRPQPKILRLFFRKLEKIKESIKTINELTRITGKAAVVQTEAV